MPIDPLIIKSQFLLFSNNKTNGQFIDYRDLNTIKNSNFNKSLPLKIIIHGFADNINLTWLHEMKDALITVNRFYIDF